MDWKKIMNRENFSKKSIQAEMMEELRRALTEIIPELNLRLLLDMEPDSKLLWVESVTVTAYESAPAGLSGLFRSSGRVGRIWNYLTGLWAKARSLKK